MADNVPKIRFPGFTEPWEQRKFKDLVFKSGKKNKKNLPYESFSITNESGFVSQNEQFENGGTMKDADKSMYIIVSPNSFAYNPARINVGSIGYQALGKNVIVSSLYEVFKTSHEVDDHFLWYWFKSDHFKRLVESLQEGGVRLYFYFDKLQKGELWLPPIEEQRKIGGYFKSVDNLITLHQRKSVTIKKLKSGLLRKMILTVESTLTDVFLPLFTIDWEQRKLGELAEIVSGGTPATSNPEYWDGTINWYTPAEISEARYVYGSQKKITEVGLNNSSAKILPKDRTILFTSRAGIGKTAILKNDASTNQGFQSIVVKNNIDPEFVYSMSTQIKEKAERVAAGSTFSEISGKQLGKIILMIPGIKEQQRIGELFSIIDNLITLHQRKLDDLKKLKQGLLQQMLV